MNLVFDLAHITHDSPPYQSTQPISSCSDTRVERCVRHPDGTSFSCVPGRHAAMAGFWLFLSPASPLIQTRCLDIADEGSPHVTALRDPQVFVTQLYVLADDRRGPVPAPD
jgi:hypothetical protein